MPDNGVSEVSLMSEQVETQQSLLTYLRLFWANRRLLLRAGICAILASALIALLIPVRYRSVTRLMPPDGLAGSGVGMLATMAGRSGSNVSGFGGLASDLLGVKSSGALFVGIVGSATVQDGLIETFQLKKVYRDSKIEDARRDLAERTDIAEDRKVSSRVFDFRVAVHLLKLECLD